MEEVVEAPADVETPLAVVVVAADVVEVTGLVEGPAVRTTSQKKKIAKAR